MKTSMLIGIILIVIGIIALAYQGITYTTREKVVDIGPIHFRWYCARGRHRAGGCGKQERLIGDKTEMCIGDNKMKKLFFGTILLALVIAVPLPTMVRADVNVVIALPPPIVFAAPPELIVLPDTYVYVVPDAEAEIFFYNGWWWRPWEGRWYRSYYYNRGWGYYSGVPSFYFDVDPGWRGYYRDRSWYGHRWDYERIPNQRLHQNWKGWQNNRHWEKSGTWGVQSYQPRPQQQRQELRQQRQQQYKQRPEVQKHQVQQQRSPVKVQQPQRKEQRPQVQQQKPQEKVQQPQRKEQRPQVQQQKPQEKVRPQSQTAKPQVREAAKPQSQKADKPHQDKLRKGKPERGDEDKQDKK
jgi:hypothetical protein